MNKISDSNYKFSIIYNFDILGKLKLKCNYNPIDEKIIRYYTKNNYIKIRKTTNKLKISSEYHSFNLVLISENSYSYRAEKEIYSSKIKRKQPLPLILKKEDIPDDFNRNDEIIKKIIEKDDLIIMFFKKYMFSDTKRLEICGNEKLMKIIKRR